MAERQVASKSVLGNGQVFGDRYRLCGRTPHRRRLPRPCPPVPHASHSPSPNLSVKTTTQPFQPEVDRLPRRSGLFTWTLGHRPAPAFGHYFVSSHQYHGRIQEPQGSVALIFCKAANLSPCRSLYKTPLCSLSLDFRVCGDFQAHTKYSRSSLDSISVP